MSKALALSHQPNHFPTSSKPCDTEDRYQSNELEWDEMRGIELEGFEWRLDEDHVLTDGCILCERGLESENDLKGVLTLLFSHFSDLIN